MPQLVFIRDINPNTFLHLTVVGEAFCLRRYPSPNAPPVEVMRDNPGCNATTIREMANREGNMLLHTPGARLTLSQVWYERIARANQEHLGALPPPPPPPPPEGSLLATFRQEVSDPITSGSASALKAVVDRWVQALNTIEDKENIFNRWCNDPCHHRQEANTGLGWTASFLEFCRQEGQLHYVETMNRSTDFALLAMGLRLGISSQNNPFHSGQTDYIIPDGLAVRRDGTAAVLEVKGPQDESDPIRCILQAFCATLAVYAKRDMLTRIAHQAAKGRPAVSDFCIPAEKPSLGVYVLISRNNFAIGSVAPLRELCKLLFTAFTPLKNVVLFGVDPHDGRFPGTIQYDLGFQQYSAPNDSRRCIGLF